MRPGTPAASSAFPYETNGALRDRAPSWREDQNMTLFESVLANEKFVLPKQSWLIAGLTLGASLVAVVLALA